MRRSSRRLLALIVGFFAFLVVAALVYQQGMARLEGRPRTFWQAFEWAGETLSTTGYGADARWEHPAMVLLVIGVQFVGVFLVYLIFPIFLIPFLEERFEEKLPREAPQNLEGHIVIYRYGPPVESLIHLLSDSGVPALVVELDETAARAVIE